MAPIPFSVLWGWRRRRGSERRAQKAKQRREAQQTAGQKPRDQPCWRGACSFRELSPMGDADINSLRTFLFTVGDVFPPVSRNVRLGGTVLGERGVTVG